MQFYLWLPVTDNTAPTREQLDVGVNMLEKLAALGKKVYVHCKNGHGRAPTLVAAYLMKLGKTVEEAEQFLKTKRVGVHLQDAQKESLRTFQQSLKT